MWNKSERLGFLRGQMNGFPIKPAVTMAGRGRTASSGLPRDDAATPSFHATTRRSPKIPNAATAASSGMPKGRAVLYPANQARK
jgi:hypothetical protein